MLSSSRRTPPPPQQQGLAPNHPPPPPPTSAVAAFSKSETASTTRSPPPPVPPRRRRHRECGAPPFPHTASSSLRRSLVTVAALLICSAVSFYVGRLTSAANSLHLSPTALRSPISSSAALPRLYPPSSPLSSSSWREFPDCDLECSCSCTNQEHRQQQEQGNGQPASATTTDLLSGPDLDNLGWNPEPAADASSTRSSSSTSEVSNGSRWWFPLRSRSKGGKKPPPIPLDPIEYWTVIGCIVVLVLFGGMFAGLTIGLMSIDETNLSILKRSGNPTDKMYAERIEPIRKDAHLLLVTLLLANTVVNETLPVLFHEVQLDGYQAVLCSTVLVLIFGEIIPQAVCARYGLQVGAMFAWPVRILIWIEFIIAYPVAKLLDYILGHKDGMIYRRAELKELIAMHDEGNQGPLSQEEVSILRAVLELRDKTVLDVMTKFEDVVMLPMDAKLDRQTIGKLIEAGHSRVPVYNNARENVIGVLLVKQLVLLDPDDATPLADIPIGRLPRIKSDTPLFEILHNFEEGGSHMAVVVDELPIESTIAESAAMVTASPLWIATSPETSQKRYVPLGIVTLEDVIEEMIGQEIIDETDVYVDVGARIRVGRAFHEIERKLAAKTAGGHVQIDVSPALPPSFLKPPTPKALGPTIITTGQLKRMSQNSGAAAAAQRSMSGPRSASFLDDVPENTPLLPPPARPLLSAASRSPSTESVVSPYPLASPATPFSFYGALLEEQVPTPGAAAHAASGASSPKASHAVVSKQLLLSPTSKPCGAPVVIPLAAPGALAAGAASSAVTTNPAAVAPSSSTATTTATAPGAPAAIPSSAAATPKNRGHRRKTLLLPASQLVEEAALLHVVIPTHSHSHSHATHKLSGGSATRGGGGFGAGGAGGGGEPDDSANSANAEAVPHPTAVGLGIGGGGGGGRVPKRRSLHFAKQTSASSLGSAGAAAASGDDDEEWVEDEPAVEAAAAVSAAHLAGGDVGRARALSAGTRDGRR